MGNLLSCEKKPDASGSGNSSFETKYKVVNKKLLYIGPVDDESFPQKHSQGSKVSKRKRPPTFGTEDKYAKIQKLSDKDGNEVNDEKVGESIPSDLVNNVTSLEVSHADPPDSHRRENTATSKSENESVKMREPSIKNENEVSNSKEGERRPTQVVKELGLIESSQEKVLDHQLNDLGKNDNSVQKFHVQPWGCDVSEARDGEIQTPLTMRMNEANVSLERFQPQPVGATISNQMEEPYNQDDFNRHPIVLRNVPTDNTNYSPNQSVSSSGDWVQPRGRKVEHDYAEHPLILHKEPFFEGARYFQTPSSNGSNEYYNQSEFVQRGDSTQRSWQYSSGFVYPSNSTYHPYQTSYQPHRQRPDWGYTSNQRGNGSHRPESYVYNDDTNFSTTGQKRRGKRGGRNRNFRNNNWSNEQSDTSDRADMDAMGKFVTVMMNVMKKK